MPVRAALLVASSLLVFTGCFSSDPEKGAGGAKPFAGVTLTVAVPPKSGFAQAWDTLLIEWSARTGAEVQIKEVATAELAAPASGSTPAGGPALLVFPLSEASDLVAAEKLAPVPQEAREADVLAWNDIPPGLATAIGSVQREPTIVPISSPVLVLYSRSDLLEKAGLTPPETWENYQKLLDTLGKWAPGLSAVEPWGDDFRATMFLARAAGAARPQGQYSFFFDIETGEPIASSPAFVKTLEQAKAAVAKMPADVFKLSPEDCRRRILAGEAALAIAYEVPDAPSGSSAEAPKRAEGIAIGISPLPGTRSVYNRSIKRWETPSQVNRPALTGFRGLGAGVARDASEPQQQAAWNLLATLIAPGNLEACFPGPNRSACRTSQLSAPSGWTGSELTSAESAATLAAVESALRDTNLSAELPVPGADEFRRRLSEALATGLQGDQPPAETMAAVQTSWSEAAKSIGPDRIRQTYRVRMGLPAK